MIVKHYFWFCTVRFIKILKYKCTFKAYIFVYKKRIKITLKAYIY